MRDDNNGQGYSIGFFMVESPDKLFTLLVNEDDYNIEYTYDYYLNIGYRPLPNTNPQ